MFPFFNNYPGTDLHEIDLAYILKLCAELLESNGEFEEWRSQHEAEYHELKNLYDKVMQGDLPQSVEDFLDNWMSENARDLVEEFIASEAGNVFEKVANKNFNALLFTDLHYIHNTIAGVTAAEKLENIKTFINSFNDIDVAFSLGDQTNDNYPAGQNGTSGTIYNTQRLFSGNYMWALEQPIYWMQGNHDSYPEELWNKYYPNKKQYFVESNPIDFIVLNVYGETESPSGTGQGASFGYVDVDFLEECLNKSTKKVVILAHDLRPANITTALETVLNEYRNKIICIFTGHYHHYFEEVIPLAAGDLNIYHLPSIGGDPFVWYGSGVIPNNWQSALDTADKWSAAQLYTDDNGLHFSLISVPATYTYNGVSYTVGRETWKTVDLDADLISDGITSYKEEKANHLQATAKIGVNNVDTPKLDIMENIQNGDDLNDYTTAGTYKANTGVVATSLLNRPTTLQNGFLLYVMVATSNNHDGSYCTQIIINSTAPNAVYIRHRSNNVWGSWGELVNTANLAMAAYTFSNGTLDLDLSNKIDISVPVPGTVIIVPMYRRRTSIDKMYGSITLCDGVHVTTYTVNITVTDNTLNVVGAFKITDGTTIEQFTPVYLLCRSLGASVTSFYY